MAKFVKGDDAILCQITSKMFSDNYAVPVVALALCGAEPHLQPPFSNVLMIQVL